MDLVIIGCLGATTRSGEDVVEAAGSFSIVAVKGGSGLEVEEKLSWGGGELGAVGERLKVSEVSGPCVVEVWCKGELTASVCEVLTCRGGRSLAEDTSRDEFQS